MIQLNSDIQNILKQFAKNSNTEAIVIAGSRASNNSDKMSDYDVYIYSVGESFISEDERTEVYSKFCSNYEVGNHYFEYEDNIVLNCGVCADLIFRNIELFERFSDFMTDGKARLGYTTAFWHNIRTSEIYYDKNGRFAKLQKKCDIPYPQNLKKNIIQQNMNMLSGFLPSYDKQIKKAVERGDLVSICHRTAEYMASYFDIIFAINEMTHPGEKKLISICKEKCKLLPDGFEENITKVFKNMYGEYNFVALNSMYINLRKLIDDLEILENWKMHLI